MILMGGLTECLVLEGFHQNIYFGCRFVDREVGVFFRNSGICGETKCIENECLVGSVRGDQDNPKTSQVWEVVRSNSSVLE
jgi:hypothetical protein